MPDTLEDLAAAYGLPAEIPLQGPPALSGNRNVTPELAELIRRDAAAAGILNPVMNFTGAKPGQRYGVAAEPATVSPDAGMPAIPAGTAVPTAAGAEALAPLLAKYLPGEKSAYAGEIAAARQAASEQEKAFQDMIQRAIQSQDEVAPSKAEMYFRLASAFGAPTKTGHFMENVGMAAKELGEHARETRTATLADKQRRLQLALEAQKLRMQGTKEDLTTLRALEAQDVKGRADFSRDLLKDYLKSGQPQSEAGKIAVDAGLKPGSPQYNDFVKTYVERKLESGDLYKQAMLQIAAGGLQVRQAAETRAAEQATKLTPSEVQLKTQTEDSLSSITRGMSDLAKAYQLNQNSFGGSKLEQAQYIALAEAGSKDPKVINTAELENILKGEMVSSAGEKMKGVLSDSDIKLLKEVQGINSRSKEERGRILRNAYGALAAAERRQRERLNHISSGVYRSTAQPPATGGAE